MLCINFKSLAIHSYIHCIVCGNCTSCPTLACTGMRNLLRIHFQNVFPNPNTENALISLGCFGSKSGTNHNIRQILGGDQSTICCLDLKDFMSCAVLCCITHIHITSNILQVHSQ